MLKMRNIMSFFKILPLILFIGASWPSAAQEVRKPTGPVLLTVTGKIQAHNGDRSYQWDMGMLEALPQKSFKTMTPWAKDPIHFSGPLLRDVLRTVKADGPTLQAKALNDYVVAIPSEDAKRFDVVLAIKINGSYIPLRQRGPLFVVYPFDSHKELQNSQYYERSIWQLKSLTVQ